MRYSLKILLNISLVWSECDITIEDADKCGLGTSVFGNRQVVIPTTDAELDAHCSTVKQKFQCVRSFVDKCLSGFVKQTTELALNSGVKHLDKRCDNPKDRQEFLTHIKCLTSKDKIEPFHVCADKNMVMMEMVLNLEGEDAVGAGCCIFHVFQDCIRKRNKEICGDATTDYWDDVINEIAEDSMALSCTGYDSLEKCEKGFNPKIWSEIKAIEAIQDSAVLAAKHTHQSGIALMIDFMKKLSKSK